MLLQCGCGVAVPLSYNKEKLSQLQILMTQQQVRTFIGDPDEVRGSLKNIDGDIVTVWQYDLYRKSSAWTNLGLGIFPFFTLTWWTPTLGNYNRPDSYWLYFVRDKLAQWGRAGDWQPDVIMQIRIKSE
jgi:hypothetical protein